MFVSVERSGEGVANNDVGTCMRTEQECLIITTSDVTSTLAMSSASCGSDGCSTSGSETIPVMYIIIGGAAGGVVILIFFIAIVASILVVKMSIFQRKNLQNNPTYKPTGKAYISTHTGEKR